MLIELYKHNCLEYKGKSRDGSAKSKLAKKSSIYTAKKIGHINQIWVTSVSPRVYIYIYIYILCIYIYIYIYTLGFTHCMPVP